MASGAASCGVRRPGFPHLPRSGRWKASVPPGSPPTGQVASGTQDSRAESRPDGVGGALGRQGPWVLGCEEVAARAAKDAALHRAYSASGLEPTAFADSYGLPTGEVQRMLERVKRRSQQA